MALALRREGDFRDAPEARQLGVGQSEFARGNDQRAFGWIALHPPASLAVHESRIVGKCRRPKRLQHGTASAMHQASGRPPTVNSPSGM